MFSMKSIRPFFIIYDMQLYARHTPITMQSQHMWLESAPNAAQNMR